MSPVGVVNINTSPHFVVVVLTTNISDNFSISLIASTFKHTNQVAIGGRGAKLLFPLLQRCSPAQHGRQNNLITVVFVQLQSLTTTHLTHALKCLREKFVSQRKSTQHSHIATGKATIIIETGLREGGGLSKTGSLATAVCVCVPLQTIPSSCEQTLAYVCSPSLKGCFCLDSGYFSWC